MLVVSCHFSRQDLLKIASCVSSNSSVIMTGIVGFYGLVTTVALLPLLLTEILEIWADFSGIRSLN